MTYKAIRAQTTALAEKKERRNALANDLEQKKTEMQALKNKIPDQVEAQLSSSSAAARAARAKMKLSSLRFQDEIDALELAIESLQSMVADLDKEIEKLTGWD